MSQPITIHEWCVRYNYCGNQVLSGAISKHPVLGTPTAKFGRVSTSPIKEILKSGIVVTQSGTRYELGKASALFEKTIRDSIGADFADEKGVTARRLVLNAFSRADMGELRDLLCSRGDLVSLSDTLDDIAGEGNLDVGLFISKEPSN